MPEALEEVVVGIVLGQFVNRSELRVMIRQEVREALKGLFDLVGQEEVVGEHVRTHRRQYESCVEGQAVQWDAALGPGHFNGQCIHSLVIGLQLVEPSEPA